MAFWSGFIRDTYASRVTAAASPVAAVDWNRSSFAMRVFWPASSMTPSLSTTPKVFQNSAYSSGLSRSSSSNRSNERFTSADLIFSTVRLFCSNSRDTLRGRSAVSTSPRMNRSQGGSNSAALSMMNTRLTYSCTPPRGSRSNRSKGARLGRYKSDVYSMLPSTLLCAQARASSESWVRCL